jgi:hypothetical protein
MIRWLSALVACLGSSVFSACGRDLGRARSGPAIARRMPAGTASTTMAMAWSTRRTLSAWACATTPKTRIMAGSPAKTAPPASRTVTSIETPVLGTTTATGVTSATRSVWRRATLRAAKPTAATISRLPFRARASLAPGSGRHSRRSVRTVVCRSRPTGATALAAVNCPPRAVGTYGSARLSAAWVAATPPTSRTQSSVDPVHPSRAASIPALPARSAPDGPRPVQIAPRARSRSARWVYDRADWSGRRSASRRSTA